MDVLFLTPYILGDPRTPGSSTDVRVHPLAQELEKRGIFFKFFDPMPTYTFNPFNKHVFPLGLTDSLRLLFNYAKFDVLFISRCSSFPMYMIQKRWRKNSRKVIFDIDDSLFIPSKKWGFNIRSPFVGCLEKVMEISNALTVSSHFILFYAKKFNINSFLIHTPVDINIFYPATKKKTDRLTIGWIGNARGHFKNLEMLRAPLMKLGKQYDICFKIVSYLGDNRVKMAFKQVEEVVEVDYGLEKWVALRELPKYISDFDLLVSPLVKSFWFEGKSIVRTAVGMAMSLPVVASPVGEQKYVIKHGFNGFLAKNGEEWYLYLKKLLDDDRLRETIGKRGRETAQKQLSLNACGKKLFDVVKGLIP